MFASVRTACGTACRTLHVGSATWTNRNFTAFLLLLTLAPPSAASSDHGGAFVGFGFVFYWPFYIDSSELLLFLVLQIILKDTFYRTSSCGDDTFILSVWLICHGSSVTSPRILLLAAILWYQCCCDNLHVDVMESSSFVHITAFKMEKGTRANWPDPLRFRTSLAVHFEVSWAEPCLQFS